MRILAKIERVSEDVEGEVSISIGDMNLVCFGYSSLPQGAGAGDFYVVEVIPVIFGDYCVREMCIDEEVGFFQINNNFSYYFNGRLSKGCLSVRGVSFEDEFLMSNFGYLDGKMISWRVDRIDLDFFERKSI